MLMLMLMFYSACVFLHARVTELWLHFLLFVVVKLCQGLLHGIANYH